MSNYPEGGDDKVADFQVGLPQSTSNDLLEFQEAGLSVENGGDGGDAGVGGLALVQNDGHNGGKEFILVDQTQRCQRVDDVGAQSFRHHSIFGVRDQTLDGRRDLGVGKSQKSNNFLLVGLGILESFDGHAAVLADSVGFA